MHSEKYSMSWEIYWILNGMNEPFVKQFIHSFEFVWIDLSAISDAKWMLCVLKFRIQLDAVWHVGSFPFDR